MRRGRLPLTALRSFEVAGRLCSFTQAAQELLISQAAVSRQVRELEAMLGQKLFERGHRSVHLTSTGERLLRVLTASFDEIGACLDELQRREARPTVSISAEPSFAACWLVPHLPAFQQANPEIDVSIDADPRLIEFRSHQASVAIRHSAMATSWPRVESRHLADVRITPVISPRLLKESAPLSTPGDLFRHVLLHEERRDLWQRWFESVGVSSTQAERGPIYADGGLVLQAAMRGQGVALADEQFVIEEIETGGLVRPFETSISYGAYWLVARSFDALSQPASSFVLWLEDCWRIGSSDQRSRRQTPR